MRNREKKEKECLYCGKIIPNRNEYCNNKCQSDYQVKLKLDEWLGGKNISIKGGTSIPPWMRRYLLTESNYKCSCCGWGEENQFSGMIPLEIDHLDGNAYNNQKENLKVVCPNCHSLTKTYKNIGSRKSARTYRK